MSDGWANALPCPPLATPMMHTEPCDLPGVFTVCLVTLESDSYNGPVPS